MSIPIDEAAYNVLKDLGPDDDIDLAALGIDQEALQAAIQESIEEAMLKQLQNTTQALDSVDYTNPVLLAFYTSLLVLAFLVFRLKSIVFSLFVTIATLLFVVFDEEIAFFLGEHYEQLGFTMNPFTFDNIFMNFSISLPTFVLFVYSFALLIWQVSRRFCCPPSKSKAKRD